MKQQYLIGQKDDGFIRLSDGRELIGYSLTLEEAKEAQKVFKNSKIYKLIEIKKWNGQWLID